MTIETKEVHKPVAFVQTTRGKPDGMVQVKEDEVLLSRVQWIECTRHMDPTV